VIKAYVDTSVIVARYKPDDPLHEASENLFKLSEAVLYISPLTIVELYSVLSRVRIDVSLEKLTLHSLIRFIIKDCRLQVVSIPLLAKRSIAGYEVVAPVEYYLSMSFSHQLKLRTLDLLHIAYASLLRRRGIANTLITGDENILKCGKEILATTGVLVKDPLKFTNLKR
jgi:predicted nucleic acid-binding protein